MPAKDLILVSTLTRYFVIFALTGCASSPTAPTASVTQADFKVSAMVIVSGRSKEKVMAGIERQRQDILNCYLSTLGDDPETKGTITFSVAILPSGKTKKVKVESSTVKSKFLERCVKKQLRSMKFAELTPPAVTEIPSLKMEFVPPERFSGPPKEE